MTRDELIAEYRQLHKGGQFRGLTLELYRSSVWKHIKAFGATTVLDYGCGKAEVWDEWAPRLGVTVTRYDPGVAAYSEPPAGKFDMVICCDVLEHLLEYDAMQAVADLFSHANKIVWASVCCREAKKTFKDGTNMHVTVKPLAWWENLFQLQKEQTGVPYRLIESP